MGFVADHAAIFARLQLVGELALGVLLVLGLWLRVGRRARLGISPRAVDQRDRHARRMGLVARLPGRRGARRCVRPGGPSLVARRETSPVRRAAIASALGLAIALLELRLRGETDVRTQVVGQLLAFGLFLPAAWLCWRGLGIGRSRRRPRPRPRDRDEGVRPRSRDAAAVDDRHLPVRVGRAPAGGRGQPLPIPARTTVRSAKYRDAIIWPNINRRDWRTVYPPAAQASFLTARTVFGNGVRATTWLFVLAEAAAIGLLVLVLARMRAPLERIALVAWHPIAISEIAANGHVDALALLAGAALLAAWQARRFTLAGLAVAFAALVKLGPILLVPALVRRGRWRFALAALVPCLLAYLPVPVRGEACRGELAPLPSSRGAGLARLDSVASIPRLDACRSGFCSSRCSSSSPFSGSASTRRSIRSRVPACSCSVAFSSRVPTCSPGTCSGCCRTSSSPPLPRGCGSPGRCRCSTSTPSTAACRGGCVSSSTSRSSLWRSRA